MKRWLISLLSLLMIVTLLPWDAALALDTSGDTQFRSGEQAYMLKVCGMDDNAEAYQEGSAITASTNARTVQNWAETLQDGTTAALRTICNDAQDNCAELREKPVNDAASLQAISQVEGAVAAYLAQLEPVNNWLTWAVEKLDYDRQRVDYLIRRYNEGGLDEQEKADTVRTCRNLTEEVVSIVAEIAEKQRPTEAAIASLEQRINTVLCGNVADASQLDAATRALIAANETVNALIAEMDSAAAQQLCAVESAQLQSQGMDFDIEVLASDEWAVIVNDVSGNKPLPGVKVTVTATEDRSIRREYTTDDKGMVILKYTDFKPKGNFAMADIEISKADYRIYAAENVAMFGGAGRRFSMTRDNGKPYIISASFDKMELMQTVNTYYVTKENNIDHTITLRVNTKGSALKVQYYETYFTKITESGAVSGDDVKVVLKGKWLNGTAISEGATETRFYLYKGLNDYETCPVPAKFAATSIKKPTVEKSNAIKFAPGAGLSLPKDVLGMGKLDFSLDLGLPEVSIMADVGGRFYMAIGDKLKDFTGDDHSWKSRSKKEQDDKVKALGKDGAIAKMNAQKQIMKEGCSSKKAKFLGEGSVDFSFYGMASGEIHNGRVSLDGGGAISIAGKIDFTWQFFIPTPFFAIPAFFALDFGVAAMFYKDFGIQFDYPDFTNFAVSSASGVSMSITVTIGATLGVGFAKMVNVYGRISGTAGIAMFIGKTQNTMKFSIGWGWEIGVQVMIFKAAWRNGPFEKSYNVKMDRTDGGLSAYVLTRLLNESGTDHPVVNYPILDSEHPVEDAIASYPEFNAYMANWGGSWTESANTVALSGEGLKPKEKVEVLSSIALVGSEIRYATVDGKLFGFWITPNCEFGGVSGVPKLVWVNIRDPQNYGVVDLTGSICRGQNHDIDFDVCVSPYNGRDIVSVVINSAPVSGYNEQDKRPVYITQRSRLTHYNAWLVGDSLSIFCAKDMLWPDDPGHRPYDLLSRGWIFVSPTVTAKTVDGKQYLTLGFCMQRPNGTELLQSEFFSSTCELTGILPGQSGYTCMSNLCSSIKPANTGWQQIWSKQGNSYKARSFVTQTADGDGSQLNFSCLTGYFNRITTIENVTGLQPVYDADGALTSALYLKRDAKGITTLSSAAFRDNKVDVTDYDIVVEADHFKVSPTMKGGSYYVYWVEQSKGAKVNGAMITEPKYTIKCSVFDATEKLFSPMFTLLETDEEIATADLQFVNGRLMAFCIAPSGDWSSFGKLAYLAGKLYRYDFDFKAAVDMVGVGADEPVLEAGMDNQILVKVTNPGNLPVTKFGVTAYYYDQSGEKKLMKSFLIDTATQENSQITSYTYAADGTMTLTTTDNDAHQVYEVPAVGDENDTRFIRPTLREISEDGSVTATTSNPRYLKLLMPGYTRTYKFALPIPKEWAGSGQRKRVKLYVEVDKILTVSPEDSFLPDSRSAEGQLVTSSGAVIPEYAFGIDQTSRSAAVTQASTPGGLTLTWGQVQDTNADGGAILTLTPSEQLTVPCNDLWIDVTRHMMNGVEYCTVTIGNKASDDVTPDEPPTLVVTTDGVETFRYTFARSIGSSYGYMLDVPTFRFSKKLTYEKMVFTVENSAAFSELDDYDNSCQVVNGAAVQPSPTPTPLPPVPPVTGDQSMPGLWLALAALSMLTLGLLLLKRRCTPDKK